MKNFTKVVVILTSTTMLSSCFIFGGGGSGSNILESTKETAKRTDLGLDEKFRTTANEACKFFSGDVRKTSNWYANHGLKSVPDFAKAEVLIEGVLSEARAREGKFSAAQKEAFNDQYTEMLITFDKVKSDLMIPYTQLKIPRLCDEEKETYCYEMEMQRLEKQRASLVSTIPTDGQDFWSSIGTIYSALTAVINTGNKLCADNLKYIMKDSREQLEKISIPADPWVPQ